MSGGLFHRGELMLLLNEETERNGWSTEMSKGGQGEDCYKKIEGVEVD